MIGPGVMERHTEDFGLNLAQVPAFSVRGVWDHDRSRHLNVHHTHQVLTVSDGMLLLEDDRQKQPLYRSMAAFIPAGTPHRALVLRERANVTCHSLFLASPLYRRRDRGITIFEISDLGAALLKKLNERNRENLTVGVMGHCLRLLLEILRTDIEHAAKLIRLPEVKAERNTRIVEFIRDNYMNRIRLEHFRRVLPVSTRQLCRCFLGEVKITIFEYLRLYRLLHASLLLHEPDRKIIDVALDCGYESGSSFYGDFRRHFGMPPNVFRRKVLAVR